MNVILPKVWRIIGLQLIVAVVTMILLLNYY